MWYIGIYNCKSVVGINPEIDTSLKILLLLLVLFTLRIQMAIILKVSYRTV